MSLIIFCLIEGLLLMQIVWALCFKLLVLLKQTIQNSVLYNSITQRQHCCFSLSGSRFDSQSSQNFILMLKTFISGTGERKMDKRLDNGDQTHLVLAGSGSGCSKAVENTPVEQCSWGCRLEFRRVLGFLLLFSILSAVGPLFRSLMEVQHCWISY